jgi:GntR family transcriptional regulator
MTGKNEKMLKYQKIKQDILELIEELNLHQSGNCLPSEHELCEQFQASRMTVRKAVSELEDENILYRLKGKGTFVVRRDNVISQPLQRLTSFTEDMSARGMAPSSRILLCEKIAATHEIADKLRLEVGDDVLMLRRLRAADGEPIAIETTYLNGAMFSGLLEGFSLPDGSLYKYIFEELKIRLKWAIQSVEVGELYEWEAELLDRPDLKIALLTHRQTFDEKDVPIEFVVSKYRSDRYKYYVELRI